MIEDVSWSELTRWRSECHGRFGTIHDLRVVELGPVMQELVGDSRKVLDVGAGVDQPFHETASRGGARYFTMDTDPLGDFDFERPSDVPDDLRFDLAVANQVLEHLLISEAVGLVRGIADVLAPGGRFAATVPNASHPIRQWGDATHVTAWPVFDLYGLFRLAGFEVDILARYGKRKQSSNPFRRLIVSIVAEEFRMDWEDSILIVARLPT